MQSFKRFNFAGLWFVCESVFLIWGDGKGKNGMLKFDTRSIGLCNVNR